jgi:hypothetical protein
MEPKIKLFEEVAAESRWVYMEMDGDCIAIRTIDSGATAKAIFGQEEYEFIFKVANANYAALMHALLKDRFLGRKNAGDEFAEFCKINNIPHDFFTWHSD